ncbi:MAG: DUF4340 domain-containing protein [Planctomycetes bacterium]|nr:DUF4340 domain-containing protein [Planctomycetota bacterium]
MRAILLLLLLAGGLTAVLLWTEEKPATKVAAEIRALDGRSLRDSKRIWWQFAQLAPVEIVRGPDGFRLTEPVQDVASPAYLKQICDAWDSSNMRATPLADDAAGRAQAGLEPPQLRFLAEFDDGLRIEYEIGAAGPLGTTQFLRRDGRIWEGGNGLLESLRVGVDDLRDPRVFRNVPTTVQELRVEMLAATGKREVLHLVRERDDWLLRAPVEGRADPTASLRFLTAVLSLRVDTFVPGVVRLPETEPAIVIRARGGAGEEELRLWTEQGQVFGRLPGRGSMFGSGNRQYVEIFENAADHLRARILVPLGDVYARIGEVVIDPGEGGGDRIRLRRESETGDWRLLLPVDHAVDPTPVNELVQSVNNLHAVEFVLADDGGRPAAGDARYGLGAGRLQVTVRALGDGPPIDLWLGAEVRKNDLDLVYACRADDPRTVVLVPQIPVQNLRRPWIEYCSRVLLRQPNIVERVDLARRTGERRTYRLDGGHWRLEGSDGARDDVGSFINDVLRDCDGSRAVDVRGEAFAAADWTLSMQRGNGDQLELLRIWERGPDVPLVVQRDMGGSPAKVGFELVPIHDKQLRELWR